MGLFQIIFNPTSAAELAAMPKRLQLEILGQFRGIPSDMVQSDLEAFGKLEKAGRTLYRFRLADYRIYFERHRLGVVVHRILTRNTLKDFFYRSNLKLGEDEALQANPEFWAQIEKAGSNSA
jgi:mRNA-degrading endonuclease RelE of RelBE toxin-antitoxin system